MPQPPAKPASATVPELTAAGATEPSRAPRGGVLGALFWPLRLMKRLYAWVVGWADTRYGAPALFVLSFVEASFFPIPPDPLLIALCIGKRRRSLWYGLVCTVASVLGGVLGWYIGRGLFDVAEPAIRSVGWGPGWFGTPESAAALSAVEVEALPRVGETVFYPDGMFYVVKQRFDESAFWAYFSAALTPIPYKVFTVAGGVFDVSLPLLVAGSIVGRGMRFFGLSTLILFFGDRVKPLIEKYFEWLTLAALALGIAGFVLVKYAL